VFFWHRAWWPKFFKQDWFVILSLVQSLQAAKVLLLLDLAAKLTLERAYGPGLGAGSRGCAMVFFFD